MEGEALVPDADGYGYRFRHALLQEAAHEQLLPCERTRSIEPSRRLSSKIPASRPEEVPASMLNSPIMRWPHTMSIWRSPPSCSPAAGS